VGDFRVTVENSAKLHILIIDDEALIRWSVGETLAHAGYDVSEGGSAKEALQRLAAALCPTSSCSTASVDVHEV
jgi:DNA-binding NtrC family response regulator